MSSAPLRVGVISANWGMSAHLPAWRANRGVEVVGVCTAHRETAQAAARTHEIPMAFWDYREMVSHPDIDLVDIGTRPNLRYEMCMEALRAGKHVYNGIPFADTLEHARDLRDAAESARSVTAIDAYSEYLPPIVMAKEIIDDNGIGELYSVNCVLHLPLFNAPRSDFAYNWFWDRANGCSALRNLGSHALNVVYRLFGEVEEVIAQDMQFVKEWQFTDADRRTRSPDRGHGLCALPITGGRHRDLVHVVGGGRWDRLQPRRVREQGTSLVAGTRSAGQHDPAALLEGSVHVGWP